MKNIFIFIVIVLGALFLLFCYIESSRPSPKHSRKDLTCKDNELVILSHYWEGNGTKPCIGSDIWIYCAGDSCYHESWLADAEPEEDESMEDAKYTDGAEGEWITYVINKDTRTVDDGMFVIKFSLEDKTCTVDFKDYEQIRLEPEYESGRTPIVKDVNWELVEKTFRLDKTN